MMSPQGLYPDARTVLVMGLHHPDVAIELGGERHSQEIGPYTVQYLMNSRLDELSYRMATFLEEQGFAAVPIVSSNIWRYNEYKDLKAVFAPDVSHIYMAVVAGLSDIGFQGLSLTPEYGARNRFVTVITNADVEPDPLIPPGSICDKCMLCRTHCPADALSKEIDGEKVLRIDDYEYRFPNKNLWRCSWGEHFDLDLDLDLPDVVTEQVIKDYVAKYGIRSGEMGQCLKFCLPKNLRTFDKSYSRTPVRKNPFSLDESIEYRSTIDRIVSDAYAKGAEFVLVETKDALAERGVDLEPSLPGAQAAITVVIAEPEGLGNTEEGVFSYGARYIADSICYDIARSIEDLGFRSVMTIEKSGSHPGELEGPNITGAVVAGVSELSGKRFSANTVITRKSMSPRRPSFAVESLPVPGGRSRTDLTGALSDYARELGVDLFGVSGVERISEIREQVAPYFEGESLFRAKDQSIRFTPWEPEVVTEKRVIPTVEDRLSGARSVILLGMRYHNQVLRWATRPPAEAVGPYSFQTYVTAWMASILGSRIAKRLESYGYRAAMTFDLLNTGSTIATPRGQQPDTFGNRFAALAAGLGRLTVSGKLATPQFGINQRFLAIVTDAPLTESAVMDAEGVLCDSCDKMCVSACPLNAFVQEEISVAVDGATHSFYKVDAGRCDWSKRYALEKASGFGYLGSQTDEYPGDTVTAEGLTEALKAHDAIKKYRPVVAEPCVLACPYSSDEPVPVEEVTVV
jgi:epoxyqueuosine reductase QueG